MNTNSMSLVDVFPLSTGAFGIRSDWFEIYVPKLIHPTYLLMILLLVISIGIMALKRFRNSDLEKKFWNIPAIITIVVIWPILVLSLKDLVDTFNTFLVLDVFQFSWKGFGFPSLSSTTQIIGWSAEGIARLLPNLSYWIIYSFYIVFFFFFSILGPFILAKGILFDEIEAFLEVLKELVILYLWQTTLIIFVAFIMPDIVSGNPFPSHPKSNFYFLSLILGLMILFVPSVTRKFAGHLGKTFVPPGVRWLGGMMGLSTIGKVSALGLSYAGLSVSPHKWGLWRHRLLFAHEVEERNKHQREILDLENQMRVLEREGQRYSDERGSHLSEDSIQERQQKFDLKNTNNESSHKSRDSLIENSKRAKVELEGGKNH